MLVVFCFLFVVELKGRVDVGRFVVMVVERELEVEEEVVVGGIGEDLLRLEDLWVKFLEEV